MSRALRWQYDPECESENPPEGCEVVNCEYLAAMEYRYQGGRGRYMVRPRDPETMGLSPYSAADGQWFDYDGDEIYGDLSLRYDDQSQRLDVTDVMAHEPGLAQYDNASRALHHLHGNLIGTTERMTDAAGAIAHRAVYTAFGELIEESGTVATRYGYAGAYGYQSASSQKPIDPLAELGWLHVGERYYDPSTGRFAQRDPIGIRGGANVYLYTGGNPTASADPEGRLLFIIAFAAAAVLIITDTAEAPGPDDTGDAMRQRRQQQEKENFWAGLELATSCVPVFQFAKTGGWLGVGYRARTFAFRAPGTAAWLVGVPGNVITKIRWVPGLRGVVPVLFRGAIEVAGHPAARNCFWTVIRQMRKGWFWF
jgi:RHS repeat-associated protein